MTPVVRQRHHQPYWGGAAAVALAVHLAVVAGVARWVRPATPPVPEPVVLVELPPEAAPAAAQAADSTVATPQPVPQPVLPSPPVVAPLVKAPLPRDAVSVPVASIAPPVRPTAAPGPVTPPVAANPVAVAKSGTGAGLSTTPGTDPKARKQEADYFSLVSAHLNRKKVYPPDAKKARQQGVVTVRFTVDRRGNVSAESIKRSSGHDLLDLATLALVRRVSPLPPMPSSMTRDSITLSLPIEYALSSK